MLVWPVREGKLPNISSSALDGDQEKGRPQIIEEGALFAFLETRVGKLDAVVITGGEPTMQADLPEFISRIKKMGFLVKLDTNGTNPNLLNKLIKAKLIDYIAMDVKAPIEKYDMVVGVESDLKKIKKCIKIIKESGVPYEFRTTIVPKLIDPADIKNIGEMIKGADKWYLQQFRPNSELVNKSFEKLRPYTTRELDKMCETGKKYAGECGVR